MACKGQLLLYGENAHLVTFRALGRFIARQDKRGLCDVHLASQLLHLVIGKTARVGEHRKLVSLEWTRGKNIEMNEAESALAHGTCSCLQCSSRARWCGCISSHFPVRGAEQRTMRRCGRRSIASPLLHGWRAARICRNF